MDSKSKRKTLQTTEFHYRIWSNAISRKHIHGVLLSVNPLWNISSSPPIQRSPLTRNIHVSPPFSNFSGTKVPIPWFTDIIYKIIQNFTFLKTCLCHSSYNAGFNLSFEVLSWKVIPSQPSFGWIWMKTCSPTKFPYP